MTTWIKIENVTDELRKMKDANGNPVRFDLWAHYWSISPDGRAVKSGGFRIPDCVWDTGKNGGAWVRYESLTDVETTSYGGRVIVSHIANIYLPTED